MNERATPEMLEAFCRVFNAGPTAKYFGFEVSIPSSELVRVDLRKIQLGQRGGLATAAVNGGVLAALFDFALGLTAMLSLPTRHSATIQLSMQFENAVRGDAMYAEAWIDRQAKHVIFASSVIKDEKGTICARATGLVSLGKEQILEERVAAFAPKEPA